MSGDFFGGFIMAAPKNTKTEAQIALEKQEMEDLKNTILQMTNRIPPPS
jgi:hypothetical protein